MAAGAVAVMATLYGVQRWRVARERAAIYKKQVETEARLRRLKEEFNSAKVEQERLKKKFDEAKDKARQKRSPPYFDSPGWRNDTGKPSGGRTRPLPVDPSRRRPEERDQLP